MSLPVLTHTLSICACFVALGRTAALMTVVLKDIRYSVNDNRQQIVNIAPQLRINVPLLLDFRH
eukprot:m.81497 g.81497  ORF g.81497 m.81497 type:complete len:64 (-) comp20982_c0_seq10:1298-1489(-)